MSETVSQDANGVEWAKLSELTSGSCVKFDNGFTCLPSGVPMEVCSNDHGLFVPCSQGQHYLNGQADDGEHCVGVYGPL